MGTKSQQWVFEQGWVRSLSGTSIQDYRTFDVATFNELHEDPGYFKKEVKQSSEMNYEELSATYATWSRVALTLYA